ncbi:unnamed protein product [Closterium sp. NIES-53]
MYLITCTRPDLTYPLSLLARYVAPGRHRKVHWDAAKRVLRYLCSTSGMGLVLGGRARVVLTGHADAWWVDNLAKLRSSQGYTFSLGSGSVSWRSTRSSSILSSSCEAEIYARAMAAQELRWLTYLLADLGEAPRSPPVLFTTPPRAVSFLLRTSRFTSEFPSTGPASSGESQVDPLPCTAFVEVVVGSGAARGAASGVAASGGAEPGVAQSEGAGSGGAERGGEEPGGAEPAGVGPGGVSRRVRSLGLLSRKVLLRLEILLELHRYFLRSSCVSGLFCEHAFGVELPELELLELEVQELLLELVVLEVLRLLVLEVLVPGVVELSGLVVLGALELETLRSLELLEFEALARVALELEELELMALALEALESEELELVALTLEALELEALELEALMREAMELEKLELLTVEAQSGREPCVSSGSPVFTARGVPRSCPPPVPGTHTMTLRPSSVPLRVPLPAPPESSLPAVPDRESDRARATRPTVSRLLATADTDPSFESAAASALVAELLDFAATCRLDYATALDAESESANPPSVGGEYALGTDILEDRQEDFECLAAAVPRFASMLLAPEGDPDAPAIPTPRSYAEAITGPYSSQWQAAMDAEMASWKSTGTYVDEVPPPGANIVDGMWIFRGVDYFQTFSPTSKMTTLRVLLHVAAQRDYELHSLDFSTAFLQGSLHEEIWLRRPPGFTGSFLAGTQTTLAALGFAPSTADPSMFLRTDTSLPLFYVLVYIDDLVFATADTEAVTLVKCELQKRHTCIDLGELRSCLGLQMTWDRTRRTITLKNSHMVHQVLQRFGFQFSSPQPTPLCTGHSLSAPPSDESVELSGPYPELVGCLISSFEAEIYAGAMAAQELRWLTYLLTNLGEQPRSPPVLYVDNKAMIAFLLCLS